MKLPIRTKVAVITSLIIIFFGLLASFFVYYVTRKSLLTEKRQTLLTLVTEKAKALSKTMLIGEDVAKLVSESRLVKNFLADPKLAPSETMNRYLEHFNIRNEFSAIYLMTATGSAVVSTDRSFIGNNYGFRNYFKDALSLGGGREVAVGVTSRQQGFYFSFPVKDETGKILGVAIAKMRNTPFDEVIKSNEFAKLGETLLVDLDGIILFSSKPEWVFRTLSQIGPERLGQIRAERKFEGSPLAPLTYEKVFEEVLSYQDPTVLSIYDREEKRNEIISLARVNESNYFMILESGVNEVIRQSLMVSLAIAGFVLLTALVTNGLAVGFLGRSLAPLDSLMKSVRQLGSGDFSTSFTLKTGDEIEELGSVFNQMVTKLRETYSDLDSFKRAVENASSHIIITDPEAKIIYANPAASKITGYFGEEMIGNNPRLWGGQMNKEFYQRMWQQIKFEKKPFRGEIKNKRKSGEIYTAIMTISPMLDEKENLLGFVGLEDDISDRIMAEEKLMEEKVKDELILSGIGEGVVAVDENGKITMINPEAAKMFGVRASEAVGKNYKDVWDVKDGLGNVLADRPIQRSLTIGESVATGEYFYTDKDKNQFPVFTTVSPIIQNGKVTGAIDVFRDITKEKTIDRAKSEFVSLASHQLRTPLSAVNWYAEMLLSGDLGAVDPNQKKYLEEIYDANRRMVELVNALLNVSRIDLGTFAIEPEELDLPKMAKSVISELSPQTVYKKLQLREHYDPLLPIIKADPKLTRIIFQNLLTNAVRYTADGGKIDLDLKLIKSGTDIGNRKAAYDGILIKVADNGFGIPENVKEKVFEKLFRADNAKVRVPEGTGLGLYIVKSIVDAVTGSIWFDSRRPGDDFLCFVAFDGNAEEGGDETTKL